MSDEWNGKDPEEIENKKERNQSPIPPRYGYYQTRKKGGGLKKTALGLAFAGLLGLTAAFAFKGVTGLLEDGNKKTASGSQVEKVQTIQDSQNAGVAGMISDTDQVSTVKASLETAEQPIENTSSWGEGTSAFEETDFVSTGKGAVADVASASMPAVVAITSVSIKEVSDFWGYRRQYASSGSGSGIIVGENEEELLIATNNHVIEGTSTIRVFFYGTESGITKTADGSRYTLGFDENDGVEAVIKGTDQENDLAVVAVKKADIPAETLQNIRIAVLGDSDDLVVGEQVVAIGNALGYGQSLTSGWISALNRTVVTEEGYVQQLIQTDAAINFGNSGGALLNMKGEVIGINSSRAVTNDADNMGYAIPISVASPILEDLMNRESREKLPDSETGYMGVSMVDLSSKMKIMYDMPDGPFVEEVYGGSPAETAGILRGDIIQAINGEKVSEGSDVLEILQYYAAGETVEVTVARPDYGEYRQMTLSLTLGSRNYN